MEKFENKMLVGNTFGVMLAKTITSCKGRCLKISECISMNVRDFNATFLSCEFLNFDHYGVQERYQLVDAPDVDYYVVKVFMRM